MSGDVWKEVYQRLVQLIEAHRTTLIFVNTRRMAERAARALSEILGEEHVTAHHGSLAKEQRLAAEQRLKRGELKALVATASLELGIDIGDVDLVVPDRLAPIHRDLPAAGGPFRPCRRSVRPKGASSRSRATSSWNVRRCSTARAGASSIAW